MQKLIGVKMLSVLSVSALMTGCELSKSPQQSDAAFLLGHSGKILIRISGDVKKPGDYWVADNISLAEIPAVAGGWGRHGEFGVPPVKAIVRRSGIRENDRIVYKLRELNETEQRTIHFKDGDVISFPTVLF